MTAMPRFAVVTDGGLDAYPTLLNDVPVAPFSVAFGERSYPMNEVSRQWLYDELGRNPVHPTSSQPSPQQWLDAYAAVPDGTDILAVTISSGLSGSRNAAAQAPLHAEFARRGGWTRAFLVVGGDGHVHSSMDCSTCNRGVEPTRFQWMVEFSGTTEAEVVAAAGWRATVTCRSARSCSTRVAGCCPSPATSAN